MILGTAAYMSPEQARGQAVDKRTDIWAFGCVLYEVLTGRPAYARATVSDTIAAVLTQEPDWTALPQMTPPLVLQLLRRCLEKDPVRRQTRHRRHPGRFGSGRPCGHVPRAPTWSPPLACADSRRGFNRGRHARCRGVCPRHLPPPRAVARASDAGALLRVPTSGQHVLSQRRHDVPRPVSRRIATGFRGPGAFRCSSGLAPADLGPRRRRRARHRGGPVSLLVA